MHQGIYNFRLSDEGLKELLKNGDYIEYRSGRNDSRRRMMLEISLTECSKQYKVALSGSLNTGTVDQLRDVVNDIVMLKDKSIFIDCSRLLSVSSIGLGLFVDLARNFQERVVLYNVRRNIRLLFDLSGLNRILTVRDRAGLQ